jgi:hypothetical protein
MEIFSILGPMYCCLHVLGIYLKYIRNSGSAEFVSHGSITSGYGAFDFNSAKENDNNSFILFFLFLRLSSSIITVSLSDEESSSPSGFSLFVVFSCLITVLFFHFIKLSIFFC